MNEETYWSNWKVTPKNLASYLQQLSLDVNQDELDRPQGGGKEVEYSTVILYWVAIEFLKKWLILQYCNIGACLQKIDISFENKPGPLSTFHTFSI